MENEDKKILDIQLVQVCSFCFYLPNRLYLQMLRSLCLSSNDVDMKIT